MNKNELIASIAKKSSLSLKEAQKALVIIIDAITSTLKAKDKVTLIGFGTFDTKKRAARMGRNPKTNTAIKINETIVPKFRAGKILKDAVANRT